MVGTCSYPPPPTDDRSMEPSQQALAGGAEPLMAWKTGRQSNAVQCGYYEQTQLRVNWPSIVIMFPQAPSLLS